MKRVIARKLLNYRADELIKILTGVFELVFDDGTIIETSGHATAFSRFFWNYHIAFPETPLLKEHHIDIVAPDGYFFNAHLTLTNNVYWEVYDRYIDKYPNLVRDLNMLFFAAGSDCYAHASIVSLPYVLSVSISHYVALIGHPSVQPLIEAMKDNASISVATTAMKKLLDSSEVSNNPLVILHKSKVINTAQLMQCLVSRGPVTDVDSHMFKDPVVESFCYGLRRGESIAMEARGANKAQFYTGPNLEKSEYFSRRMEILSMTVMRLHKVDCGSTRYLNWYVTPPRYENKNVSYRGDLGLMIGMSYLDEETGELKRIRARDKHLYGKYIKLRSVVAGCNHPDPNGVCAVCFGQLSESIFPGSNIGAVSSKYTCSPISQRMMKVKHVDSNNAGVQISLSLENTQYFTLNDDLNGYVLKPNKFDGLKIIIEARFMHGFSDLRLVDDINLVAISSISEVSQVGMRYDIKDGAPMLVAVPVIYKGLCPSFTHRFLSYMVCHGYTNDGKGNYVVDLSKWDFSQTILMMPFRHFSMGDYAEEIARVLESTQKELRKRATDAAAETVLQDLYRLVTSELDVHLSNIQLMLFATMGVDSEQRDYRLHKAFNPGKLGVGDSAIANRSMGGLLPYERQAQAIMDGARLTMRDVPDHPMDVMFRPQEVISSFDRFSN